jgi:hypothetical protein
MCDSVLLWTSPDTEGCASDDTGSSPSRFLENFFHLSDFMLDFAADLFRGTFGF